MSVIQWPNFDAATFRWQKVNQAIVSRGAFGGSQSTEGASPLWEVELTGVPQYYSAAHRTVAFLESLNGFANQVALWNLAQPVPLGTMRGAMALNAASGSGAIILQITASDQLLKTLLAGDLIGIGSGLSQQVVRVMADAFSNASGIIIVTIGTPLRYAFPSGTEVRWNQPKALFRQKELNTGIEYQSVIGQPWTLSLIEDFRP
jgi:hypothetical protein